MDTKNFRNMGRQELEEAFSGWVKKENSGGLVDIKFCLDSGTTEDAMRQLLHIADMEEKGETRQYSDY